MKRIEPKFHPSKISERQRWGDIKNKSSVPIITISGEELDAIQSGSSIQKTVIHIAKSFYRNCMFKNIETGWDIYVSYRAIKHVIYGKTSIPELLSILAIPKLIQHAVKIGTEIHNPEKQKYTICALLYCTPGD